MPRISGSLSHVTGDPDLVTSVGVSAVRVRPSGSGLITTSPKQYEVKNGQVSFPCEPGLAQLTIHYLNSAVESVPLLVPNTSSATLAFCFNGARTENLNDSDLAKILGDLVDSASTSVVDAAKELVLEWVSTLDEASWARFQKGFLRDGDNLNDFGDAGAWDHTFAFGKNVENLPVSNPGVLFVFAGTDGGKNKVTIQFYAAEGNAGIWWRIRNKNSAWQAWKRLDEFHQVWKKFDDFHKAWTREIPRGADFNTLVEPGLYKRINADTTAKNHPHGNPGNLTVFATGNQFGYVSQLWAGATNTGIWFRANTVDGWNDWVRLDENTESNPDALGTGAGRREYLVSDFYDRKGGEIGTGGKAAIALRFDHWMDDFYAKVLPLLKKYNLPWAQAINSRTNNQQAAGLDWKQLQTTAISTGGEVLNHSATHSDPKSIDAVVDEVVTGLAELESKLPLLPIDGWMQPGTGGQFMGYANYATREDFGTEAARIVMANHAVVYGHHGGVVHRLDGRIRIGQRHRGMDSDTAANVKRDIDELIRVKGGMVLMVHPTKLDASGGTPLSEYEAVLSYIAQKRDKGELVVLSTTGLQAANSAHAIRRDLTHMNVTSANASRTADISAFMADGPQEVHGVVNASGPVTVSVSSDTGGLDQTWSLNVDGWQELWLPFTLPKGASKITTRVVGASGGRITVRAL